MDEDKALRDDLKKKLYNEIEKCNKIDNFDERIKCKSDLLYQVTEVQDYSNLNIMSDFRDSDPACSNDKRWIPVHIVDNANAIILGIARNKFHPSYFWRTGSYVDEKYNALQSKFWMLKKNDER